jgi:2-oxoglutarate decarboxylase
MARRAEQQRSDVAIIRMERLYPLPVRTLPEALAAMPQAQVRWVQEEPANQGAWPFMALNLPQVIDRPLTGDQPACHRARQPVRHRPSTRGGAAAAG